MTIFFRRGLFLFFFVSPAFARRFEGDTSDAQHPRVGPVRGVRVRARQPSNRRRREIDRKTVLVRGYGRTRVRVLDGPNYCAQRFWPRLRESNTLF